MKKNLPAVAMAACLFLTSGCATIINGSSQQISIASTPAQATVTVDGEQIGVTPLLASLSRKKRHLVKISMEGYLPYEVSFARKVDAWIAGNIIFGGLIGLAVDAATGGMYKLTPDQINTELKKGAVSSVQMNGWLYCAIVLKADKDWRKIGQLSPQNPSPLNLPRQNP